MISYLILKFIFKFLKVIFLGLFNLIRWIVNASRPARTKSVRTAPVPTAKQLREAEQTAQREAKQNERIAKAQFAKHQAEIDLDHLQQQRRDIMKCYEVAEAEMLNASTDRAKERAMNRCVAYNDRIRRIDKQIDKCVFVIERA